MADWEVHNQTERLTLYKLVIGYDTQHPIEFNIFHNKTSRNKRCFAVRVLICQMVIFDDDSEFSLEDAKKRCHDRIVSLFPTLLFAAGKAMEGNDVQRLD